jgi:TolB-like protein/DNA-binding winged helix-turn-helix (wHTH) protein
VATVPYSVLHFGTGFELDPRAWQLRRNGVLLLIEHLPMQVLMMLIGQHGEPVSRASIVEHIWGPRATFDTTQSVDLAVGTLRATLGDDPAQPRFIQAESDAAYRFIAAVTETPAPALAAPAPLVPQPLPPAPKMRAWVVGTLSVAVLAIETLFFMHLSYPTPAAPPVMLAVLPLTNLTGNPGEEDLSNGLTDELIAQLGQMNPRQLGVIARTSVMPYKNSHQSTAEIARALNAQYLLEGSVGRDGEQLRISAQLVRASDEAHVWAQHYDRPASSVLELKKEIAHAVAEELDGTLRPTMPTAPQVSAAPIPPEHNLYLPVRGEPTS